MARPRKSVDPLKVIELASNSLTLEEIAARLNVSDDTIHRHFAAEVERGRKICDASLRNKQYDVAMSGDTRMLIHLGKNRLGQTDKTESEISGSLSVTFINKIPLAE